MITSHDLFLVGFLVFLEGILSIDNAIVLALLARGLPKEQQKKALTYGLIGAVIFRLASLFFQGDPCKAGLLIRLSQTTCDIHPSRYGQGVLAVTVVAANNHR